MAESHLDVEFITGKARLCDLKHRAANMQAVTDPDILFQFSPNEAGGSAAVPLTAFSLWAVQNA
jgi:hypothetical protein